VIARLVRDSAFDVDHFERIEGQPCMMPLRIRESRNGVEDRLIDALPHSYRCHDVLMLVMF
jgi:hypothetical protein